MDIVGCANLIFDGIGVLIQVGICADVDVLKQVKGEGTVLAAILVPRPNLFGLSLGEPVILHLQPRDVLVLVGGHRDEPRRGEGLHVVPQHALELWPGIGELDDVHARLVFVQGVQGDSVPLSSRGGRRRRYLVAEFDIVEDDGLSRPVRAVVGRARVAVDRVRGSWLCRSA